MYIAAKAIRSILLCIVERVWLHFLILWLCGFLGLDVV